MKSTEILLSRMDIDEQNQINEYFWWGSEDEWGRGLQDV